jgi:hypothetical protein
MDDVSPSDDGVAPQSSGVSAQFNQQTAYKKVRFDSVLPQVNGMPAHKEVSLDSIFPQINSRLQDLWECVTAGCKAFSLANVKGTGTNDWVIRSLDD